MDNYARISTSARRGQPNAIQKQVVRTPLVLSVVIASKDTKATEKLATIKTSAVVVGLVIGMQVAETPMVPMNVVAAPAFMAMVSRVAMWMSAKRVSIIVTPKLSALIPGDHTVVAAREDIMEMAGSVRLLLLDGSTHSLEFLYLAILSPTCCNCFVRT